MIRIGDEVMWRGGFGIDPPKIAVVESMEVTKRPRDKYGKDVNEVGWDLVRENRVLFTLTNNHWAYSDQISEVK